MEGEDLSSLSIEDDDYNENILSLFPIDDVEYEWSDKYISTDEDKETMKKYNEDYSWFMLKAKEEKFLVPIVYEGASRGETIKTLPRNELGSDLSLIARKFGYFAGKDKQSQIHIDFEAYINNGLVSSWKNTQPPSWHTKDGPPEWHRNAQFITDFMMRSFKKKFEIFQGEKDSLLFQVNAIDETKESPNHAKLNVNNYSELVRFYRYFDQVAGRMLIALAKTPLERTTKHFACLVFTARQILRAVYGMPFLVWTWHIKQFHNRVIDKNGGVKALSSPTQLEAVDYYYKNLQITLNLIGPILNIVREKEKETSQAKRPKKEGRQSLYL